MQEYVSSIITGVVASLIAVSLQTVSMSVSRVITSFFTHNLYYYRLTKLAENSQTYIVSGSIPNRRNKGTAFLMGPDATAALNVKQSVEMTYPKMIIKHMYSGSGQIGVMDENIISVGGPVFNGTTAALMNELSSLVSFDSDDSLIVNGKKYQKCLDQVKDYGFICRMSNPFAPDRVAIIIAGCGSNGVLAASQILKKDNRLSYLKKNFCSLRGIKSRIRNNDFIAVVEAKCMENEVASVRVLDVINI